MTMLHDLRKFHGNAKRNGRAAEILKGGSDTGLSSAAAVSAHEGHLHRGQPKTKFASGGPVVGASGAKRLDKYARGGAVKKGAVTVNVIVAGKDGGAAPVPPFPVGAGGLGPSRPPAAPPPGGPQMMPQGLPPVAPGGPSLSPMPQQRPPMMGLGPSPAMRPPGMKRGGAVHMTAGAESGLGRLQKSAHAAKIVGRRGASGAK